MSEEAELERRSWRTIVLKPEKSPAAVEAASVKNYNKKKEAALRKRNVKILQVGGSSKSTRTPGSSSSTTFKGKHSFPHSLLLDQSTASSFPLGALNISKSIDDALPFQMIGKLDGNSGYEKGIPAMTFNAMRETPRGKGNNMAKSIDLRRMLITLLRNKPHGLTLKALEKAFQPIVQNPLEKIKPILRIVARYKSPGRYILLPGVDFKSLNKPQVEIGSSSNANCGQGGGTSDGESDSDSESDGSDSGSDTGSDSSSSAGTGSESESGSERDASFNSQEGLDEDMDFMISNEKKELKHKAEASVQKLPSTIPVRSPVGRSLQNEADEMQDKDRSRHGHSDYSAISSKGKQRMDSKAKNVAERIKKLKAGKLAQAQGYPSMGVQLRERTWSFNSIGLESFDKSPVVNRRGVCLQRDLLDLKSGEPVKSTQDETLLAKQFERKITFKHPGNRADTLGEGKLKAVDTETEYHTKLSQMNSGFRANELGVVGQGIESEGSSKGSITAPGNAISKRGTEGGTASYPEEEKRQERNSLEDVADKGKGPIIADENDGDQKGKSSSEDDSRYFKYEKAGPEFKGPIRTMAQYHEYVREYNEKYPDYVSLLKNVEGFRCNFEQLCNNLEKAKNRDEDKYREILGQIKETYECHVPHHKRLKMIFVVLHQELEHMKQMMSDFANAQNKKNARNKRK